MRIILLFGLHFLMTPLLSQDTISNWDDALYHYLIKDAEFPGGRDSLFSFKNRHKKWPDPGFCGQGLVVAEFTVTAKGVIKDIKIIRSIGPAFDEEVRRIIELMPKWKPEFRSQKPVASIVRLPFRFSLE